MLTQIMLVIDLVFIFDLSFAKSNSYSELWLEQSDSMSEDQEPSD